MVRAWQRAQTILPRPSVASDKRGTRTDGDKEAEADTNGLCARQLACLESCASSTTHSEQLSTSDDPFASSEDQEHGSQGSVAGDLDEEASFCATSHLVYNIRRLVSYGSKMRQLEARGLMSPPAVVYRSMPIAECTAFRKQPEERCGTRLPIERTILIDAEDTMAYPELPFSGCDSPNKNPRRPATPGLFCSSPSEVERAARSILNKLTMERFDSLYEQLASCGMKTPEHLKILVQEVFQKATIQHHFIGMYADLCVRIQMDPGFAEAAGSEGNFRKLLLTACQEAFEDLLESNEVDDDSSEDGYLRKRRALGNVKLIGQLLVRGMLSSRLLLQCAESLLASRESCQEALECLAALLRITGKSFDQSTWTHYDRFDQLFKDMSELCQGSSVPPRSRFLLRDVLDLREAGWQERPCEALKTAGPMKLDAVRELQAGEESCKAATNVARDKQKPKAKVAFAVAPEKAKSEKASSGTPQSAASSPAVAASPSPGTATPAADPAALLASVSAPPTRLRSSAPAFQPQALQPPRFPQPEPEPVQQEALPAPVPRQGPFEATAFRRELSVILKDLNFDCNVAAAVRKIRLQNVPVEFQADEFADILTRAAEECRGAARRSAFAFAAGLAAAEPSAFDRTECLLGAAFFFGDVYEGLCAEVPRLQLIVVAELLPTLRSVFPAAELRSILPAELRSA